MINESMLGDIRADMLKFARLQLRDESLAEDMVQEALAAALTGAKEFAGRSALKTWVFAILRNKIVDQIRAQSRTTNISAFSQEEESMDETFEMLFQKNDIADTLYLYVILRSKHRVQTRHFDRISPPNCYIIPSGS